MIARRRATGEQQLGAGNGGRTAQGFGREPGPDRIEREEPIEQTRVLRPGDGQRAIVGRDGRAQAAEADSAGEREEIAQNQHYPGAPYWKLAARFGQLELKAHLKWADETLAELRGMAANQRSVRSARKEKKHAGK